MRFTAIFLAIAPSLVVADWSFAWWKNANCSDTARAGYIGMKPDDYKEGGSLDSDIYSVKFTYDSSKGLGFIYNSNEDPNGPNVRLGLSSGDCFELNKDVPNSWAYYPGA